MSLLTHADLADHPLRSHATARDALWGDVPVHDLPPVVVPAGSDRAWVDVADLLRPDDSTLRVRVHQVQDELGLDIAAHAASRLWRDVTRTLVPVALIPWWETGRVVDWSPALLARAPAMGEASLRYVALREATVHVGPDDPCAPHPDAVVADHTTRRDLLLDGMFRGLLRGLSDRLHQLTAVPSRLLRASEVNAVTRAAAQRWPHDPSRASAAVRELLAPLDRLDAAVPAVRTVDGRSCWWSLRTACCQMHQEQHGHGLHCVDCPQLSDEQRTARLLTTGEATAWARAPGREV